MEHAVFVNQLAAMSFAVKLLQQGNARQVQISKHYKRHALQGYTVSYRVKKAWLTVTEDMALLLR